MITRALYRGVPFFLYEDIPGPLPFKEWQELKVYRCRKIKIRDVRHLHERNLNIYTNALSHEREREDCQQDRDLLTHC